MREPVPSSALLSGVPPFAGFPVEGDRFLKGLAQHNDRRWFEAHRGEYDRFVLAPMRAFVLAAGDRLRARVPRVEADPRVGGSIYRLARDTRFSPDKTPFKTWSAAHLWERSGAHKNDSVGFYIQVEPGSVWAGGGRYRFNDEQLERWKKALRDPRATKALRSALARLRGLEIGGEALKRVPRGFEADHPAADLLRHKGIYAGGELDPKRARTAAILDDAVKLFLRLLPLHRWLAEHVVEGAPRADRVG